MKLEDIHKVSDAVSIKMIYVDICDDLVSGVLLNQIMYWSLPDRWGQTKLRVQHDGHLWIAKKRTDWYEEIRISAKQYDRAIAHLQKLGFVQCKVFKFGASTMSHVRINAKVIENAINSYLSLDLPKGQIESSPKGKPGITERSIPSYTEITNRDYDTHAHDSENQVQHPKEKGLEILTAYLQSKVAFGYSSKFLSLIVSESEFWSHEVVKHLIDRIAQDPSKPSNYYKRMIDNWAKIKPTPTTAEEVIAGDQKGKRPQRSTPQKVKSGINIEEYLDKEG